MGLQSSGVKILPLADLLYQYSLSFLSFLSFFRLGSFPSSEYLNFLSACNSLMRFSTGPTLTLDKSTSGLFSPLGLSVLGLAEYCAALTLWSLINSSGRTTGVALPITSPLLI